MRGRRWLYRLNNFMSKKISNTDSLPTQDRHDPVCGMNIKEAPDFIEETISNKKFYFCSSVCASRFKKDPDKFKGEPLIHLHETWKVFKEGDIVTEVLRGVNVHIWKGDFVAIIGASGSGKSTLLNMVGLLDRPTSGGLFLEGRKVSDISDDERVSLRSKKFGFVFQQYNLVPWLSAYDNVLLPLIFSENGNGDKRKSIVGRFQELGLGKRMDHRPAELSGGEQQRVALMRALANNAEVLICDEPTGNLDSATGEKILNMLIDLNKREGKTLVIVTHDSGIAERADQIVTLRDGRTIMSDHYQKKIYTG